MSIQIIPSTYSFSFSVGSVDSEEKEIMRRLLAYGITPTGNKSADRAKLHAIELEHAKNDNYISNKYYTVTKNEQEKIQEHKKEIKKLINKNDSRKLAEGKKEGAKLLGEQLYLAIKLKNEKEMKDKKQETNISFKKEA